MIRPGDTPRQSDGEDYAAMLGKLRRGDPITEAEFAKLEAMVHHLARVARSQYQQQEAVKRFMGFPVQEQSVDLMHHMCSDLPIQPLGWIQVEAYKRVLAGEWP